ncbi:MAG: hypothetical protein ABEK04_02250 [Candidatus Nanohalobium sp.]
MPAEELDSGLKIGAGVNKLDEDIGELETTVQQYGKALQEYLEEDAPRQKLEETADQMTEDFQVVFSDQNWLGETTAELTDTEVQNSYQKFIAYRGLVRAADELEENENSSAGRPYREEGFGSLRSERTEVLDTWNWFLDIYSNAVDLESRSRRISAEEAREEEGLEPYAFDTPFMLLEEDYDRVSDLNQCVNSSYR